MLQSLFLEQPGIELMPNGGQKPKGVTESIVQAVITHLNHGVFAIRQQFRV